MKPYFMLGIGLFFTQPAFSNDTDTSSQWNYLELSRLYISYDNGRVNGYGLSAKYSPIDIFYISGTLQQYPSPANEDIERTLLGLGLKYEITPMLTPYIQIEHVTIDSDYGYGSNSSNYLIEGLGLSGMFDRVGYKLAATQYTTTSHVKRHSGYTAEMTYLINTALSMGVTVESANDGDGYSFGIRVHF